MNNNKNTKNMSEYAVRRLIMRRGWKWSREDPEASELSALITDLEDGSITKMSLSITLASLLADESPHHLSVGTNSGIPGWGEDFDPPCLELTHRELGYVITLPGGADMLSTLRAMAVADAWGDFANRVSAQ